MDHSFFFWFVFLLLVWAFAAWVYDVFWLRSPRRSRPRPSFPVFVRNLAFGGFKSPTAANSGRARNLPADYGRLLSACLGDHAKVDRLVNFEIRRNPSLSYDQAVSSAYSRLDEDRWQR